MDESLREVEVALVVVSPPQKAGECASVLLDWRDTAHVVPTRFLGDETLDECVAALLADLTGLSVRAGANGCVELKQHPVRDTRTRLTVTYSGVVPWYAAGNAKGKWVNAMDFASTKMGPGTFEILSYVLPRI